MILHRLVETDQATFGTLTGKDSTTLGVTLELPWKDNQHDVSRVPAGTYQCHRRLSPKRGYEVFELADVPGRQHIEIHIGNLPHDTEGCILIGTHFGDVNGEHGIVGSGDAFRHLMEYTRDTDTFTLTIIDPSPDVAAG